MARYKHKYKGNMETKFVIDITAHSMAKYRIRSLYVLAPMLMCVGMCFHACEVISKCFHGYLLRTGRATLSCETQAN